MSGCCILGAFDAAGEIVAQAKLLAASISRQHSGGFSGGVQAEVGDWHSDSKISRKRTKTAVTVDSCVQMKPFS